MNVVRATLRLQNGQKQNELARIFTDLPWVDAAPTGGGSPAIYRRHFLF